MRTIPTDETWKMPLESRVDLHRPTWPSIVLRPGEEYVHRLRYRLGAD